MTEYTAEITKRGVRFTAFLNEAGKTCSEYVRAYNPDGSEIGVVHQATFAASNLATAKRTEYCRVMLASIADSYFRV